MLTPDIVRWKPGSVSSGDGEHDIYKALYGRSERSRFDCISASKARSAGAQEYVGRGCTMMQSTLRRLPRFLRFYYNVGRMELLSKLHRNVRTVAFVVRNGNVACGENVRMLYAESYV